MSSEIQTIVLGAITIAVGILFAIWWSKHLYVAGKNYGRETYRREIVSRQEKPTSLAIEAIADGNMAIVKDEGDAFFRIRYGMGAVRIEKMPKGMALQMAKFIIENADLME
jgi:hypothetical protein